MSTKMKVALGAVIALVIIAAAAFFARPGGPLSPEKWHYESGIDGGYDAMEKCIAKKGAAACTVPFLRGGLWVFDAGDRISPACLAATYKPGEPHHINVRSAPAGCYIGARAGEFCIVVKGESDETHCRDSSGRNKRNSYCLVTGVCTD